MYFIAKKMIKLKTSMLKEEEKLKKKKLGLMKAGMTNL
jgi:hypothetical protein